MKVGIVVFPGSNCDADCHHVVSAVFGQEARYLWHRETSLGDVDAVIVPGGFSYGDYLRCGAIAKFSPLMTAVKAFAQKGGPVLGICNGFQILTEAGLLPGVLIRNQKLKFICDTVGLSIENARTPFTSRAAKGAVYRMPIAHMEGNYFTSPDGLKKLEDGEQIVFRYVTNPNGSLTDIAGVCNEKGNVVGLMPHPERVCEMMLNGTDGRVVFESLFG